MLRPFLVRLHRYAGLALAFFLIVAGASGAVIAFTDEIDTALNPDLRLARPGSAVVSAYDVIDRIQADDPRGRVTFAQLAAIPGRASLYFVKPRTPNDGALGYNQVYVDPGSGAILGKRHWGAFTLDRRHFVPWVYEIHYSLFLPSGLSGWFLGLLAAIWAGDCFVGLALTFPARRPFWRGWTKSWRMKSRAGGHRRTVDVHRAGGLWLWALLLIMAATGFYLRVGDFTVRPLLASLSSITLSPMEEREHAGLARPAAIRLAFRDVVPLAEMRMRSELGGQVTATSGSLDPDTGIYSISFRASRDNGIAAPTLYIDGNTGKFLGRSEAFSGTLADKLLDLPRPLHGGKIAGLPGRIIVALTGIGTVILSITGLLIWQRKRRSRRARAA